MKLVIVESPNKCETIKKYLGNDFKVDASIGHIRDLAISGKDGLGVDIAQDFKPTYKISANKTSVVTKLKKHVKEADEVYLATDPDREGEAISWHLAEVLKLPIDKTKRLEFHEITKKAILKALENPRTIDMDLVSSQETRRIIDRIMGFKMSTLLKSKIKSESAGRVQSVALRLITDRQKQRDEFVSETYYTIEGLFSEKYKAQLSLINNEKVDKFSKEEGEEIVSKIPDVFKCSDFEVSNKFTYSKMPFKTSTLQIEAGRKFKTSASQTQRIAQELFEMGLITYIRTEGETISAQFIEDGKDYVINNFGKEYLASFDKLSSLENKQDSAHEAIRPTSLANTPDAVKAEYKLDNNKLKIYKLIYNRTLAALMGPRKDEVTTFYFTSLPYKFKYQIVKVLFDGFTKVYAEDKNKEEKIKLKEGDEVSAKIELVSHNTEPPTLYNEARLVKAMEDEGIGRPSTYASTIETLYKRKYIENDKDKNIIPTEQGILTSLTLQEFFPPFMEVSYTSEMEKELDDVKYNDGSELKILNNFYNQFVPFYDNAKENMQKVKVELDYTGNECPLCNSPLVWRKSRFGKFEACSNYPTCKYVAKPEKEPLEYLENEVCPECGKPLVKRKSKKGEFYACSGFPNCHYIKGNENRVNDNAPQQTDEKCPKCGKPLIRRKGVKGKSDFLGCSNFPRCRYSKALNEGE